jgi:hypothetical protein
VTAGQKRSSVRATYFMPKRDPTGIVETIANETDDERALVT